MKHYWGGCVVAFLMAACAGSVSRADDGKSPAERPPATRPGRVIAGVVLDPQGKPVPHADVTPDSFGGDSAVETDEQGRFQLTGVAAGKVRIKAKADGFAPQAREVSVAADMKPVELRLEKGRVLRGRVVEGNDKPVANATVSIERWQNVTGLGVYLRTDAEGRFAWNDAPPDAVTLAAHKQGYPEAPTIEFTAGEQECRIALKPASVVNVAGTVLDDATGKPIDRFRVYVTATGANGRTWLAEASGAAGKYEAPINRDAESYSVRIEADDYLTTTSPHLRAQNGPLGFSARIRKPRRSTASSGCRTGSPRAGPR